MRGHRSTRCAHTNRILVRVRKPGRPLDVCPHKLGDDLCSICDLEQGEVSCTYTALRLFHFAPDNTADKYRRSEAQREAHDPENQRLESAPTPEAFTPILIPPTPRRTVKWNSRWVSRRELKASGRSGSVDNTSQRYDGVDRQGVGRPHDSDRKHNHRTRSRQGPNERLIECTSSWRPQSISHFGSDGGSHTSQLLDPGRDFRQLSASNIEPSPAAPDTRASSLDKERLALSPSLSPLWREQNRLARTDCQSASASQAHCASVNGSLTAQSECRLPPIHVLRGGWPQLDEHISCWEKVPLPSPKLILQGRLSTFIEALGPNVLGTPSIR